MEEEQEQEEEEEEEQEEQEQEEQEQEEEEDEEEENSDHTDDATWRRVGSTKFTIRHIQMKIHDHQTRIFRQNVDAIVFRARWNRQASCSTAKGEAHFSRGSQVDEGPRLLECA